MCSARRYCFLCVTREACAENMSEATSSDDCSAPLCVAVYGSKKKFVQNFAPFIVYCDSIADWSSGRQVQTPLYIVDIDERCEWSLSRAAVERRTAAEGEAGTFVARDRSLTSDDAVIGAIDVLFMKLSSDDPGVRNAVLKFIAAVNMARSQRGLKKPLVVVEHPDVSDAVLSRSDVVRKLGACASLLTAGVHVPYSLEFNKTNHNINEASWTYVGGASGELVGACAAVIVKPVVSNGPPSTHAMAVAAAADFVDGECHTCRSSLEPPPSWCAHRAESFLAQHCAIVGGDGSRALFQHVVIGSVILKVYAIGSSVHISQLSNSIFLDRTRAAVGSAPPGPETFRHWAFHSQDKALFPTCDISQSDASDALCKSGASVSCALRKRIEAAVGSVQSVLGAGLVGVDFVIADEQSVNDDVPLYILDVNLFPSFSNVPHLQQKLIDYLCAEHRKQ